MLQVAEGHRVPGDPDVGGVHPGPVVEPGRHPAPAEIPPVADAPGMVTLAVPFDGEHLVSHAHRAPDQTGHLVPGGDVVVVRHAIGSAYPTAGVVPRSVITSRGSSTEQVMS